MRAIITVGISCSGKSTFANKWVLEGDNMIICRDSIRAYLMLEDGHPFSYDKWNWKREKEVTRIANEMIASCSGAGRGIIIADTNLNHDRRLDLIKRLEYYRYDVEIKEFPIDIETAWKRDAARANGVGHSVIAKQYESLLTYLRSKVHETNTDNPIDFPVNVPRVYIPDTTKPKCILVDVDGTASHFDGKRTAFEWDKVGNDTPDDAVRMIVNMASSAGINVIFLSGRDGICKADTHAWLIKHNFSHDHLFMRKEGDMRKDTIVKEEIFWRDIADNYNVLFCVDDRPSVVRLWMTIGLKVFAVGNQHIEF